MKQTPSLRPLMCAMRLMLFALLAAAPFSPAIAGGPSADSTAEKPTEKPRDDVFYLGEVVVSGKSATPETPTGISEITAADIRNRGARDVGEAMALIPGVHFRQGRSRVGHYVTIRGFEQENVLILLDGVPISVPYEGLVNLPDIPVQNIARIKVIKGSASALYGPNAMGGVVNIITKKGLDEPQTTLGYRISDYNTHHLSATHGGRTGRFGYFIGGSHKESDGYRLAGTFTLPEEVTESMESAPSRPPELENEPIAPDSGRRENSDYTKQNIMFTGDFEVNPYHNLGLSLEYYNHEYGIPPVPVYREHPRGFFWFPRYWRFSDWERYTANLIQDSSITDAFRLKSRLYYDYYDNVLNIYDDSSYTTQDRIGPPSGESIHKDYSMGFNVHMFWDVVPGNQLRGGIMGKKDVHRETMGDDPYDRYESRTYSFSLENELEAAENWRVTLGGSYDIFEKTSREEAGESMVPGKDLYVFSPLAGLNYQVSSNIEVFGGYARKVRFPTMRNLYSAGVTGPIGDPDLKAEKADKYELGTHWHLPGSTRIGGAIFYSEVRDLIQFDNLIGRFEQFDKARIHGLEVEAEGDITDTVFGRLGYTLLQTDISGAVTIESERDHDDLVYRPDKLSYRPEHKVDFELRKTFAWGTTAGVHGSYISSRTFYNHAEPENNDRLIAEEKSLDEYLLVNARIIHPVTKNITVELLGENLLNEKYQEIYLFPGKGISGSAGIRVTL